MNRDPVGWKGHLLRTTALGWLSLSALVACGGDDSASRQEYIDAFGAVLEERDDPSLSADESECFAGAIVDAVGVDELADAAGPDEIRDQATTSVVDLGVDVDEADGERFYDRADECVDLRTLVIEGQLGTDEISDPAAQCFDQRFTDDLIREFMVKGFTRTDEELEQDTDLVTRLQAVFTECAQL